MMRKVISAIAILVLGSAGLIFFHGAYLYPDSPIKPCGDSYCGKQGQPRTEEEYRDFKAWEGQVMIAIPIALIAVAVAFFTEHNRKS